ncbi:proline racemase family protein [Lignipirellula cremea]|uniref:4-hydroxyproline epimerase n=1 Tax=Lignipirellula cremea TaxID=2528010 RepID=A0A518E375_9BACT|nr:proline racemase family protein [Lignipirellula cremea]QDU98550.1 4-hydroxyproline epimerase [Lignipirellula cremea]
MQSIQAIDSHTVGEPTRVVIEGGPPRQGAVLADWISHLRTEQDDFRRAVANEPRGSEALVGALLYEPFDPTCDVGVVYFNNVGWLNMCVHGTIGLVVTLQHLGRLSQGRCRIETPVGNISGLLEAKDRVTVQNVACRRSQRSLVIDVPGYGQISGDVAWGGNWFFLVDDHQQHVQYDNLERLKHCAWSIRRTLEREGIAGDDRGEIDHILLFAPPTRDDADSKNFVLCPGGAYDRSPCGTGLSAKLACLVADGQLQPGQIWRQESILGSVFEGTVLVEGGKLTPCITGSAHLSAEVKLLFDPDDPFRHGIPAPKTGA